MREVASYVIAMLIGWAIALLIYGISVAIQRRK